jgi:hypothetical protein
LGAEAVNRLLIASLFLSDDCDETLQSISNLSHADGATPRIFAAIRQ